MARGLKTGLAAAEVGLPGLFEHGNQARVRGPTVQSGGEIGLGVDEQRHTVLWTARA
jgi:hypothetical protein